MGACGTCTIKSSFTAGSVKAVDDYVGGIVGIVGSATLDSVFSTASVTGGRDVGGLVGYASGTTSNSIAVGRVVATTGFEQGALHGGGAELLIVIGQWMLLAKRHLGLQPQPPVLVPPWHSCNAQPRRMTPVAWRLKRSIKTGLIHWIRKATPIGILVQLINYPHWY